MLEYDLKPVLKKLKAMKVKTVLVQIPEGLKTQAIELIQALEKEKITAVLWTEACYGACDLIEEKLKQFNAQMLLHFGHTKIGKADKTIFIPLYYSLNKKKVKKSAAIAAEKLDEMNVKKIGLAANLQFLAYLEPVKKELEKKGFRVFLGKGGKRISEKGQVLGCNYSSIDEIEDKIHAIVFLGDGLFHPIGLIFAFNKPVVVVNPLEEELVDLTNQREKFLRKRMAAIYFGQTAKNFGVLVSTKSGQINYNYALRLKQLIEESERKAFLLAADFLHPKDLLGLKIDCFVNTACPRIAVDDYHLYHKPVLNGIELEIALGKKPFEGFEFNQLH